MVCNVQPMEQSFGSKSYDIVKASLISREILLEELKKMSNAIGNTLEDLDGMDLTLGKYETIHPSKSGLSSCNGKGTLTKCTTPQLTGILRDFLEVFLILPENILPFYRIFVLIERIVLLLVSEFWCYGWKHF
jgi:hypothetical protein